MSQLNKLLGKRDSLTPERFVEVVTRHWDRGQFRPNASMSIKGACCAWSTLAAWQGNGQSGGNGGGPLFTSTGLGAKCTIYPGLTKQQTADGFVRVIRDDTFRTVSAAEVAAARADADIWPEVERQIGREV